MKLYLYGDFERTAWAANPAHFRKITKSDKKIVLRFAHYEFSAPVGYSKGESCLANDPVTKEFISVRLR